MAAPMLNTRCTAGRHYRGLFRLTHVFRPWVLAYLQVS